MGNKDVLRLRRIGRPVVYLEDVKPVREIRNIKRNRSGLSRCLPHDYTLAVV
jgi:hypothetical protein